VLELALQNRLEALAHLHGKNSSDVALAKARIWCALMDRQAALAPSIRTQLRTKRAIRDWRLGKDSANPEHDSRINSDWAAKLVRFESLRPKRSEQRAIKAAGTTSEEDLDAIERTALNIVMGKRGLTRLHTDSRNPVTQAAHLARAVLAGWLPPEPALRLVKPENAPALTIQAIVHTVVPILDDLAGIPIKSGSPYKQVASLASLDPPQVGALASIVRMEHPNARIAHICNMIRSYRRLSAHGPAGSSPGANTA
jgi:hypothetical protein